MKQAIMFASTLPAGGCALDDANARRYSRDTQELYRLVQQLRTLVVREAADLEELRAAIRSSSTEDLLASAEESQHEADALLASARGVEEVAAEHAYKQARLELERAFFEYRQAHRELAALARR
jgi:hypothetical protein